MKSSSVSQWARLLVAAFFTFPLNGFAQVLFEDNFNTDTSANWTVLSGTSADENDAAYDAALGDFTVDFAFDYSTRGIPPAPNSGDKSTLGVKISVNNNDNTGGSEAMGVNLFPAKQNFSGNYAHVDQLQRAGRGRHRLHGARHFWNEPIGGAGWLVHYADG